MSTIHTSPSGGPEISKVSHASANWMLSDLSPRDPAGPSLIEQDPAYWVHPLRRFGAPPFGAVEHFVDGVRRRWRRERRRRKVGRAYDMALEIAPLIPQRARVLDVGCGNGYIAHHLSSLLGGSVVGIDLADTTDAPIDYRPFNGTYFPVEDGSFDATLLCYVLHHAQNLEVVMSELGRVVRDGGFVVLYEDMPEAGWDRIVCWTHNLKWRRRTGPCSFRLEQEWRSVFRSAGFEVIREKRLSRWRNLAHPVRRKLFLLKKS